MRPGRAKTTAIQLASLVVLLGLWETVARAHLIGGDVLPPFSTVVAQLPSLLGSATIRYDIDVSLYEIGLGLLEGAVIGLLLGLLVASSVRATRVLAPLVYWLSALPKIIVLPIVLLAVGAGFESKVLLAAISALFPMLVSTVTAVGEVKPVHVRVARSFGASRVRVLRSVVAPTIARPMLSGLRLSLGVAVTGALLAETSVASAGLGFQTKGYYENLQLPQMYALLLLVFVAAVVVNALLTVGIDAVTRGQASETQVSA